MKVRIINTKENPVIIKSDKKPPFVDKPSWAKDAFLLAPYKEGYTTDEAITEYFNKAGVTSGYRIGYLNYFEGENEYLQLYMRQGNDIKYLLEGEQLKPFFSDDYYMYGNHITLAERPASSYFIWAVRVCIHWDKNTTSKFIQVARKITIQPSGDSSAYIKVGNSYATTVDNGGIYTICFVVNDQKLTCYIKAENKEIFMINKDDLPEEQILYIHRDSYSYVGAVSLFTKDSEITESDIQDVLNIMEVSCTV